MIVAIDAGNSRIKWGLHDGRAWLRAGWVATAEAGRLGEVAGEWPRPARAVVCNVAGAETAKRIAAVLAEHACPATWFSACREACGVVNRYDTPEKLGADRWAALLGAAALCPGRACLVVCAGTATTADILDARGEFQGGAILPGFDLMRAALSRNTAQLPLAEGRFQTAPRNTDDAIVTGCLHAQAGAIERMFARVAGLPDVLDAPAPQCVLTGGGAPRLAPHLNLPLRLAENLVLDGLVRFANVL